MECSASAVSMPRLDKCGVVGRRVRERDQDGDRDLTLLRDGLQSDDGQVRAAVTVLAAKIAPSSFGCARSGG